MMLGSDRWCDPELPSDVSMPRWMSTCNECIYTQSCCSEQADSVSETLRAQQSTDVLTAKVVV